MRAFRIMLLFFFLSTTTIGQNQPDSNKLEWKNDSIKYQNRRDSIIHKPPFGSVNDLEQLFTILERKELDSLIKSVEKESKTEFVVLTLDTLPVKKFSFDNTAIILANDWWIGKRYNGKGILIAFSKHLRKIYISNSNKTKKDISDAETKEIIDMVILPQFKQGNYFLGIKQGIVALNKKITK